MKSQEQRLRERKEAGDIRTEFLMAPPMQINTIPDTVAFKNIDQRGGSKRFYRQVFVQEDPEKEGEYHIFLDSRILLLKGKKPLVVPNYNVALIVASEWESQAEHIRLDSMPLTNFEVKRNLMEDNEVRTRRRRGIIQTLEHMIAEDLLCLAESSELKAEGFYEKQWEPIVAWFNKEFETDFSVKYACVNEGDREASFFEQLVGKEPHEVMSEFEDFMKKLRQDEDMKEKYQQILQPGANLGAYRKWIRQATDLKLMLMDELLTYFPSPILITALVEHAFDLDFFFKSIDCPELDTQMISTYQENLKLVESKLFLAAAKCYLNTYALDNDSRILQKESIDSGQAYRKEFFGPFAKMTHEADRALEN